MGPVSAACVMVVRRARSSYSAVAAMKRTLPFELFQSIVLLHSMVGYWHHHVVRLSVRL